jgi:hypothetical protein
VSEFQLGIAKRNEKFSSAKIRVQSGDIFDIRVSLADEEDVSLQRKVMPPTRRTSRRRLMCQIAGAVYLPVVFLSSRGRRFISRLLCVLLGHVFALPRRAVKTRALPVVNTCLRIDPYLTLTPARRRWVDCFLGHPSPRCWACDRTRCCLRLGLLWSRRCFGRSRWRFRG